MALLVMEYKGICYSLNDKNAYEMFYKKYHIILGSGIYPFYEVKHQ